TPGELRSRASRMAPFRDVTEVEATLEGLMTRPDGPFITRLAREPGRRESRYAHLFSGQVADAAGAEGSATAPAAAMSSAETSVSGLDRVEDVARPDPVENTSRLARLEEEVRRLRSELDDLKKQLGL